MPPRVLIAGGSLGGLTAALVLRDIGCDVIVCERSQTPLEGRGAGIVLHPATVRYFRRGGTLDVNDVSAPADWLRYLRRDESILHEEPCRYRFTSYYTLYQGLLQCLDPEHYRLLAEVDGFEQGPHSVTVRLADGRLEECELLVCADGIHSTGRRLLLPGVAPQYSGYVGWRGTVGSSDVSRRAFSLLEEAITYYVGSHTHILTYPIPDFERSAKRKCNRINFVWYRNVAEGAELDDLMTDRRGQRRDVSLGPGAVQERHRKALWDDARAMLPDTIAQAVVGSEEPFVQAVFDIGVPRMSFGRVCLIGDAAFAVRPHAAAGTAKAAEDAWKLAEALEANRGDVVEALRRWEPGQLALGRALLERARDIGNRSQFLGTYRPPDPYLSFGLYRPGDSGMPAGDNS